MGKSNEFGSFFRETRKALGLTIAEFSRRNGFDKGNISKLERGLLAPPQKLDQYAAALKLKKDSEDWNRFYELASKQTGRIPEELRQHKATAERLPQILRKIRTGMGHDNWVKARNLEAWAETREAQSLLPKVIRRLIYATGQFLTQGRVPAEDNVSSHGLDGYIEAGELDLHVPKGRSVWEVSVNSNPAAKADADFNKRKKEKSNFDTGSTTFIVVNPRKWTTKDKWIEEKKKLRIWADVRVYDAAVLEEWLERAPAVDVWLAGQLQIRPVVGLSDYDEYWNRLQALTEPSLPPEVFLASRKKQAEQLQKWLERPTGAIVVKARSPEEAIDFVVASIQQKAKSEQEQLLSRAVVVETTDAWQKILRTDSELLLITHPKLAIETELVVEAMQKGHSVIHWANYSNARGTYLEIPRVYQHDLSEALQNSGIARERISDLVKKAGGCLTVLKRSLARLQGANAPEWSRDSSASEIAPLLLIGSWEGKNPGDQEVIESITSKKYEEVHSLVLNWLEKPDSPFSHVAGRLSFVSREESWQLLSRFITAEQLSRFRKKATEVLGQADPKLELPVEERWIANLKGKVIPQSETLRNGLAEALALLGCQQNGFHNGVEYQSVPVIVVRELLLDQNWSRWASLSHQLPLLAEAAPDEFLKALEKELSTTDKEVIKLFNQDKDIFLGVSNYHPYLLWALETLSWDRNSLPRVCLVFAHLDKRLEEKERNAGNSPHNSLCMIFMPWFPQNLATVDERLRILNKIADKFPETGWRLLLDLMSERYRTVGHINKPNFRDWALEWKEGTTNVDYAKQVIACAKLLTSTLEKNTSRWIALIDQFDSLPVSAANDFIQQVLAIDASEFSIDSRREIADAFHKQFTRHRQHPEAKWALPPEEVAKLEKSYSHFLPQDAISRHSWLFDNDYEILGTNRNNETERKELEKKRQDAINEVMSESGWDGILTLVNVVKNPNELGLTLGNLGTEELDRKILPELLQSELKLANFACGYSWRRSRKNEQEWVESLTTTNWNADDLAKFAIQIFHSRKFAWNLVEQHSSEAQSIYWERNPWTVSEPTEDNVKYAVTKLLQYKRPFQACFVIELAKDKVKLDVGLAIRVLKQSYTERLPDFSINDLKAHRHYVIDFIRGLQESVNNGTKEQQDEVGAIEWNFLSLLDDHHGSPKILHRWLSEKPDFFVNILDLVYRREGENVIKELTEDENNKIKNAQKLLYSWGKIPGFDNNQYDSDKLLSWIRESRKLAKEKQHSEMCDLQIGQLLAHAEGVDPSDNAWPPIQIRDAIEEVNTEQLTSGFETGKFNLRGVTTRSMSDGGNQERELARQYRRWADSCKVEWPTTAASLIRMAESYERYAVREDAEVDLRLLS
jgi:transcriptional regulator with XRE-family HTH domain